MRFFLILPLLFSWTNVFAERPSYRANLDLISLGGFVIFFNSQGPLSYSPLTPDEIPEGSIDIGEVKCKSCQHGLSIPIPAPGLSSGIANVSGAQGDGSFRKALKSLMRERPKLSGIYDVKVDLHRTRILGIYRKLCTIVTARGFK